MKYTRLSTVPQISRFAVPSSNRTSDKQMKGERQRGREIKQPIDVVMKTAGRIVSGHRLLRLERADVISAVPVLGWFSRKPNYGRIMVHLAGSLYLVGPLE